MPDNIIIVASAEPVVPVPASIAKTPAHLFGKKKAGRSLPTKPPNPPAKLKQAIQPGHLTVKKKPAVSTPHKSKPGTKKWWNGLSQQEQKIYLKTHPRTRLKLTGRRGVRRSNNQHVDPNAKPVASRQSPGAVPKNNTATPPAAAPTTAPAAPAKHFSLKEIVQRAEKSLSARDFAWMFSHNKSRYKNIGQEMQQISAEPKKGEPHYKQKLAAWQAQQAKANQPQAKVPQAVRTTMQRAQKIQQQAKQRGKSLPQPKNAKQATQQLFGHLVDQSDNKIIGHVNKHLGKNQKELLGQAMDYAAKHPNENKPPHRFAKALGRVLLFAVTTGAGAALMGPAGVVMAMHGIDQFANKTGESLPQFAWRALRGKSLGEKGMAEEQDREEENKRYDKTEQPVARIIKGLKQQLAASQDEQKRKPIRNLIEELGQQMDDYSQYEKEGEEAPRGRRRR